VDKAVTEGNAATLEALTRVVGTQQNTTQQVIDLNVRIKTIEQQIKNSTRL